MSARERIGGQASGAAAVAASNHGPGVPVGAVVPQLVLQAAEHLPQALALVDRAEAITYGDMARLAWRAARRLRAAGVQRESIVAIAARPGPQLVVAQLATWLAGGAYLSLDASYPRARLEFMLADSGAHGLLVETGLGEWGPASLRRWPLDGLLAPLSEAEQHSLPQDWPGPALSDLAYLLYTSGSTGRPKGVLIEHAALRNYVCWDVEAFTLGPADRVSQTIGPSFDMSVWEVWPTLVAGASLHFADRSDYARPGALWRWLAEEAVTLCVLATPLAERLLQEPTPAGLALRGMSVAGDRLRSFAGEGRSFALYNLYGPTEATINVTCGRVPERGLDPRALPSLGQAAAGAILYVLDEQGREVAAGERGELYIGGPGLARGYHGLPDLTAQRFVDDVVPGHRLYRTGDCVRRSERGEVFFEGRLDRQVKLSGQRVELGEIEAVLLKHPHVQGAVVVVEEGRVYAYVVPESHDHPVQTAALDRHLRAQLPAHMVPAHWELLERLPLTPNGKIDRGALKAGKRGGSRPPVSEEAATFADSEFAQRLRRFWRDVLGVEAISAGSDFFGLGGHSLAAFELIAKIERSLGVSAGLSDLIAAPTFGAFSQRLSLRAPRLDGRACSQVQSDEQALVDSVDPSEPFALTEVQHAYWVGRQGVLPLGDVATHLYFERDGELDLLRLEGAWNRVVTQHGMLRTTVRADGKQRILARVPKYRIHTYDQSETSEATRAQHLLTVREELSHQVLPADTWPLFDIRASLLPGRQVRLHLSFDALVLDAQSLFMLLDEWHRLYIDPGRKLLPQPLSFAHYVAALADEGGSPAYAAARSYWGSRVGSLPAEPELPLRSGYDPAEPTRFVRRTAGLSQAAWTRLRMQSHAHRLTETVVLLSVYADVVAAFAKTPQFLLNLTLFDRPTLVGDVERLVGDFTSVSLLQVDGLSASTFRERAVSIQKQLFEDLDHRAYGGIQVLRDCAAQRGPVAAPVVFTSELGFDALGRDTAVLDRFGTEAFAITQTPQVWIDLQVMEREGELVAYWDAVEGLFFPGVLDEMFEAFRAKLTWLASDPAAWESHAWVLPVATKAVAASEPAHNVVGVGSPVRPPDPWEVQSRVLYAAFLEQAAREPKKTAVVQGEARVSYGELLAWSYAIAEAIGPLAAGTLVGVALAKSPLQVAAVLGTLIAGGAYVPLDPSWPSERRASLLQDAGIGLVLLSREAAPAYSAFVGRLIAADRINPTGSGQPAPVQAADRLAYVMFTSGSTGKPKGVMVKHRAAWNTIADVQERLQLSADDRVLGFSALAFDLSVFDIFGTLGAGATLVLPEQGRLHEPAHLRECVANERVTWWNSVPAVLELLLDGTAAQLADMLGTLRVCMLSGDWIPLDLPERLWRCCPDLELLSLGGATEAGIWSISHRIGQGHGAGWSSVPYGRAMRGQRVEVLDPQFSRRPPWVAGEICIAGAGLAEGYLGDPARTAQAFVRDPQTGERWYRTGDVGRYRPDGLIELLGRDDGQIKVNGFRIELGEIEAALRAAPGVQNCAVVVAGGRGQRRILAAVMAEDGLDIEFVREQLRRSLPEYMLPHRLVALESLPCTSNRKLDRRALVRLCEAAQGPGSVASDEATRRVARVWAEVLGISAEHLDIDLNFFDAGGNSVLAVRLRSRLAALAEGRSDSIALTFVYEHSTVRAQSRALAAQQSEGTGSLPKPATRSAKGRLSPAERAGLRRAAQGLRSKS